ncbi:hypothetical protein SK128_021998 [Halocaridina rubra]|uniref:Uncharacterized protein n=1 Tax=Halocaridina rubra TaxID=373956 RepID=A0AAN8XH50_HALRR
MSHTCYNPLILCWMNTKFREGYLNVLYQLLPCCRTRISHYLLKVRQSSGGLQRAHTYSTALGSSRTSRNNRYNDDPRTRKDSTCSNTVFMQVPQSADIPLKVMRVSSCEQNSNGVNGRAFGRARTSSEPPARPSSYTPTTATIMESSNLPKMSYLDLPAPASQAGTGRHDL